MSRRQRPGLTVAGLPPELRPLLQSVIDTVARITGATGDVKRLEKLTGTVKPDLSAAALLADVIAARNADAEALRAVRNKVNEIITRLQED